MPPVTILSPYSGRPVVVREQDLGRAIRDEQGRVFYVVEDDEHGRYASMTRKGSPKDLDRYRDLQAGGAPPDDGAADTDANTAAASPGATRSAQPYDATGTKRRNPVGLIVLVLIGLAVGAAGYVAINHPELLGIESDKPENAPTNNQPNATPKTDDANKPTSARPVRLLKVSTDGSTDGAANHRPLYDPPSDDPVPEPVTLASPKARADVPRFEPDPRPVIVPTFVHIAAPSIDRTPTFFVKSDSSKDYKTFRHTASGLRYKITHHTNGPSAKSGCFVKVRYTMQTLEGKPLIDDAEQSFVLMSGAAIRAFDEGLAGVREGEQLRLFVPRGHSEAGSLPGIKRIPDKPFLMDVQLVSVKPGVTHVVEKRGKIDNATVKPGDSLQVHYTVKVEGRSEVIDDTRQGGKPFEFTLGQREVIPGLELGLLGMRLGETRLLTIPPYLAYGRRGAVGGLIPPDAVLSFRVTLVKIATRTK